MSFGRSHVGLGLFMLTLLVMMCRLHVVMSRHVVVSGRLKMMLHCFGLCIRNHGLHLRYLCLADREATLPHAGRCGVKVSASRLPPVQ